MSRKALGSVALALAAAACSSAPGAPPSNARGAGQPPPSGAIPGDARFFQVAPEDAFWVTHDASRDRVVAGGARLELAPTGEVLASAWETDRAHNGDPLQGGLAVPERMGGGYVFWTQSRVFRAADFTGPLVPVALGVPDAADTLVRGARIGLRGVVLATDAGPRELLAGSDTASSFPDPGVTDLAALDASNAIRIDVLGRPAWTTDGGKTWNDASQITGGIRALGVSPDELWFETWQGRALLGKDGILAEPDGPTYRYVDYSKPFQMLHRGTRAERDDNFWNGYRELQPLQAAVASGVRLPDGSGFGVVRGAVVRADLATGKILSIATDWLPNNIECQPVQVDGSVLFACAWDDHRGGAYVLRGDGVDPPQVERLFTASGAFVTDDDGGFGFTGSCTAEDSTYVDPDQYYGRYSHHGRYGRPYEGEEENTATEPVICVRRGPEDWVERKLSVDQDTQLLAWIPRRDGTAVALVRGAGRGATLPDLARDSQRETSQNGVRVVRVFREVDGWQWPMQQARSYYSRGGGAQNVIDRRYRALDDGTIVGWLSATEGSDPYYTPQRLAGGAVRPGGRTEMFELPATPFAMATGGAWGVLTTRDGRMFETVDRGRTWRPAGTAALNPASMQGACSISGCAFATSARLGWGVGAVTPRIDEKRPEPPKPKRAVPTIACEPAGLPKAEPSTTSSAAATLGSQARVTLQTSFGATLEMIRETPDALSSASPYGYPYGPHGYMPPPPPPTASAAPASKPAAKAAPVRTHTLVFRPPLDPLAPIVRHNATNAALGYRPRTTAIPLLGPGNEVSYLYYGDQNEALVDRNELVTVPLFDNRRYYYYGDNASIPGLRPASSRALLFGDMRRRAALEEHGTTPQKPPFYFAFDRDPNKRRVLAMGRGEDGSNAVLVLDAAAPETAGASILDRVATTLGPLVKLAPWSSVTTADDPACRADKKGLRALVPMDPSTWLELDGAALPGVTFAKVGIALVRWSEERVCLEAIDVSVNDPRRQAAGENLVVRWTAPAGKAPPKDTAAGEGATGALRSLELMQPLTCSLRRAPK